MSDTGPVSSRRQAELDPGAIALSCGDEAATRRLAEDIAMLLQPGDCLCLVGDLGAGKSTFARALLRALADDPALEVPSPTFTLVQTYPLTALPVAHFDLYRLEDEEELDELGLDEVLETGAALIEWPERAAARLPENRLILRLVAGDTPQARAITLLPPNEAWRARLERTLAIRRLIEASGFAGASRRRFAADASARRFETVQAGADRAVLIDSAPLPPQPVLRDGLSYRQLVHLADGVDAVVAVTEALRARGLRAPRTLGADLSAGLVLQEDLGRGSVVEAGRPVAERYLAAAELLARLHGAPPQADLPLPDACGGGSYRLPRFDPRAMRVEAELFLQWYLPHMGETVSDALEETFAACWAPLFECASRDRNWVLRDYHSPNLIWREDGEGTDRLGLVDTQDAMIGPAAYDVASLAMDARVDVPAELEQQIVAHYLARRRETFPGFDEAAFRRDYAIMGAQRATKILGIFTRLAVRDEKPGYLVHLPRVREYLTRCLRHPELAELAGWFDGRLGETG